MVTRTSLQSFPLALIEAVVFGMGKDYRRALKNKKPFAGISYADDFESDDEEESDEDIEQDEAQSLDQKVNGDSQPQAFTRDAIDISSTDFSSPDEIGKTIKRLQQQLIAHEEFYQNQLLIKESETGNAKTKARARVQRSRNVKPDIQRRYNEVCDNMYALLFQYLGVEPIKKLENKNIVQGDGMSAWMTLKGIYQSGSQTNVRSLFKQISNIKMEGRFRRLTAYTHEFHRIRNILDDQEIKMPPQLLLTQYLAGLSDDYTQIRIIL